MSEKSPEQQRQPQPLFDTCNNCKTKYKVTADNATANHYENQPECSHVVCTCPNCKQVWRIFCDEDTIRQAIELGIHPEIEELAPEFVYLSWARANNIEFPKTYELTNRHEALVHKFGEAITNMPDEVFWENIEAETSHPYPEKWID